MSLENTISLMCDTCAALRVPLVGGNATPVDPEPALRAIRNHVARILKAPGALEISPAIIRKIVSTGLPDLVECLLRNTDPATWPRTGIPFAHLPPLASGDAGTLVRLCERNIFLETDMGYETGFISEMNRLPDLATSPEHKKLIMDGLVLLLSRSAHVMTSIILGVRGFTPGSMSLRSLDIISRALALYGATHPDDAGALMAYAVAQDDPVTCLTLLSMKTDPLTPHIAASYLSSQTRGRVANMMKSHHSIAEGLRSRGTPTLRGYLLSRDAAPEHNA